jgi:hypothetical protein
MGWDGVKDGNLLAAAEAGGFELLIAGDQSLIYQQNSAERRRAILASSSVEWRMIRDYLSPIAVAIDKAVPGSFRTVDCGKFSPKKARPLDIKSLRLHILAVCIYLQPAYICNHRQREVTSCG